MFWFNMAHLAVLNVFFKPLLKRVCRLQFSANYTASVTITGCFKQMPSDGSHRATKQTKSTIEVGWQARCLRAQ
jgi:hypothetical protein